LLAVCFGYTGSLVKQLQNGLACFIELIRMTRTQHCSSPPVSNERLKFKRLFETNTSQKKGVFVDSYGLRLFGHGGPSS
jgi:hypothetical protein